MLDGILGRGFSVKCKSLIKATGPRIGMVRRRAEAKQRFLNEDLVKLLSNGLDINAYGRTEEFLAGMNLLSCYDFVEKSCDYILKQLSRMQKQGECPEECREAVASLMYAAARFSDFPELRDLRDVFQQKYGSLEAFVNQKFVEKMSLRPPPKEKRLQVLQDIASEFSIKWDSKGFELRMAAPSVVSQVDEQKVDVMKQRPGLLEEKSRLKSCGGEGKVWRRDEADHQISRTKDVIRHMLPSYPTETCNADFKAERSNNSSHGKILDNNTQSTYSRASNGIPNSRKGESIATLFSEKTNFFPGCVEQLGKTENAILSSKYSNNDSSLGSTMRGVDEGSDRLRSCSSYGLPPPYIKPNQSAIRPPYVKLKEDKQKLSGGSKDSLCNLDEQIIDPDVNNCLGRPHIESDRRHSNEKNGAPASVKSYGLEKEHDYQEERIPLPKPRSIRRKHHKSSPSSNNVVDALDDVKAVNKSSSSRRKDHSRKGLQVLFDDEHHIKVDEEKMIDKLLMHYSKKPTSYDAGKLKKKLLGQPPHQIICGGESSSDQSMNMHDSKFEAFPTPARSVSLPHEQAAPPEAKKVFARSNTFQPDNQATHVHPKLPDYDDLAARFAALKGR
ncbi:hypothetical protein AAHA92_12765 [Salvia divinorum]|uniref:Uncharacterized protein n=1 Tax=Salvia divinorum TaxID=28513 RepID=A0ABD1H6T3_SALDI